MNLVLLTQNGCNPCTMVKNYLNSEKASFEVVNISVESEAVEQYNIMSTPVLILLDGDEEIARVAGFKPSDIDVLIEQM